MSIRIKRLYFVTIRALAIAAIMAGFAAMIMSAYWIGQMDGAFDPARSYEIPMCVQYETNVREAPTGYVLGHVPAGAMVWFLKLELPFAHVAYYNGSAWVEGTITASALVVCGGER